MGSSRSQSKRVPKRAQLWAYVHHIGQEERGRQHTSDLPLDHPRQASLMLGRCCVQLSAGDDKAANRSLARVQDGMRRHVITRRQGFNISGAYGAHLFHLATLLRDRGDPDACDLYRRNMHAQAITEIQRILIHGPDGASAGRGLGGRLTEQIILGLLTRDGNDGHDSFVTQSLEHQDMGGRKRASRNHDLVVVDGYDAAVNQYEAKDWCLDYCQGRQGVPRGRAVARQRTGQTVIISGECDVHRGDPAALAGWLIDEAAGRGPAEAVANLDGRTASLLGTLLVPEPWRIGTR